MSSHVAYIHTNERQMLGAIASAAHSFRTRALRLERLTQPRKTDLVRRVVAVRDVRPDVFERIAACGDCKPVAS